MDRNLEEGVCKDTDVRPISPVEIDIARRSFVNPWVVALVLSLAIILYVRLSSEFSKEPAEQQPQKAVQVGEEIKHYNLDHDLWIKTIGNMSLGKFREPGFPSHFIGLERHHTMEPAFTVFNNGKEQRRLFISGSTDKKVLLEYYLLLKPGKEFSFWLDARGHNNWSCEFTLLAQAP